METTINERVNSLFVKSKEKSIRQYAIKRGIKPTTLNECIKGAEPKYSLIKQIIDGEPLVSADWLLTGNGQMLKVEKSIPDNTNSNVVSIREYIEQTNKLTTQISNLVEQNSKLTEQNSKLTDIIEDLRSENRKMAARMAIVEDAAGGAQAAV